MGIFSRKSASQSQPSNGGNDFLPTRNLKLQFPPVPANGAKFAELFVQTVKDVEHVDLDYSVDSIAIVDELLQKIHDEGITVNDFAETIFAAGAYVGEVIVRNNNAEWVTSEEAKLPAGFGGMPIMIRLSSGKILEPIGKAFKRFYSGEADSLAFFYGLTK